jgi:ankyrin repeat protein
MNKPDANGSTPLMAASYFGHISVVRALLWRGANWKMINSDGHTACCLAYIKKHKDVLDAIKNERL